MSSWASCQIRKIAGCACAVNAGNVFPRRRIQRKPLVSDPGMHHDSCVTHGPWCMSESLTHGGSENIPDIPGACASAILRIWQEAHGDWLAEWFVFDIRQQLFRNAHPSPSTSQVWTDIHLHTHTNVRHRQSMKTISHGNDFRITGPIWGE